MLSECLLGMPMHQGVGSQGAVAMPLVTEEKMLIYSPASYLSLGIGRVSQSVFCRTPVLIRVMDANRC